MNPLTICYIIAVAVWAVSTWKRNTDIALLGAIAAVVIAFMM